ncbi:MAG TPA: type III-A CRISPR-associated protein Csm2 [Smithella sp.]|jgi:CRISPR-associated protein Csm2|nr:type III-A CRISPR-associated protein Csm2 [Smithella sp.]HOS15387.1 type III-A CRISPR-associated protein Csm2 [Smithella sp.]HPX31669.1 type III-A CRISPR-associated protein Csm2 [Smithella sp.]HQC19900.1 type III-A CRISPR-associated protein Csm2 [Smithella sp.]
MNKIAFYKDKTKGIIDPKLFSDIAEQAASDIAKSGQTTMRDGRTRLDHNKRTQIRKFYDEVVRLNGNVKSNPDDWETVLPFINMLIAKAAYANGRNTLVTDDFVALLKDCVSQVQKPADLDVFANFFESFMGFYRKYE